MSNGVIIKNIVTTKLFILFSLVLSRLISFVAFPNASIFPDSSSYLPEKFLDFGLVSFMGNSVRPWPTPFFYSIFPSSSLAILAVMILSIASWYFLINTILEKIEDSKRKWLFSTGAAIFACSPFVIQWENSILAPALLVINLLVLLGLTVKAFSKGASSKIYYLGILLSALFFIQKSSNILIAVLFAALFLYKAFSTTASKSKILISLFSGIIFLYSGAIGINVDNHWKPISYSERALLWQLGGQSPAASNLVEYLKTNSSAPKCFWNDAPFQDIDSGIGNILDNCPGAIDYIKNEYSKDVRNFLLTNPVSVIKLASVGFGATLTSSASNYGSAVGIFPGFSNGVFFGGVQPENYFTGSDSQVGAFNSLNSGSPIWIYAPGLLIIFAPMFILIGYRKKIEFSREMRFLPLIQLGLLLQLTLTFVVVPTEWVRLGSQYFIASLFIGLAMIFTIQSQKSTPANQ
jgi:hypothetical protein